MIRTIHFRTLCRTKSVSFSILAAAFFTLSCSVDPQNRPSPLVVEDAQINEVGVKLSYSSPSVRERKIFGIGEDYLEQYGELWRTGANKATTIYFESDMLVDHLQIDSGTYSIFTIPNEEDWTIIFNSDWDQWGSYDYKQTADIMRLQVPVSRLKELREKMRLYIEEDSLKFEWELTRWGVPLANLP